MVEIIDNNIIMSSRQRGNYTKINLESGAEYEGGILSNKISSFLLQFKVYVQGTI